MKCSFYKKYNEEKYTQNYWGIDRSKYKWFSKYVKFKILDRWIDSLKNKDSSLLDAGGGVGNYAFLFKNKFKHVAVLDISKKALDSIPEEDIIKIHDSVINPKIKKYSFDCILLIDVFEHIDPKDLEKMMQNLGKLLKEDGKILIFTSQFGYGTGLIWKRIIGDKNRLKKGEEREGHLNRLTFEEMKFLFKKTGFVIEDFYHYSIIFQQITDFIKDSFAKISLIFRTQNPIDKIRLGQSVKEHIRQKEENFFIKLPLKILSYISYFDIILFGKLLPGESIFLKIRKR